MLPFELQEGWILEGDDLQDPEHAHLRVVEQKTNNVLASLKGISAMRMAWLIAGTESGEIPLKSYNCMGAVQFLSGHEAKPMMLKPIERQGIELSLNATLPTSSPALFQIDMCSSGYTWAEEEEASITEYWDEIFHTGIVLNGEEEDPIILDKHGEKTLRIRRLSEMLVPYAHPRPNHPRPARMRYLPWDQYLVSATEPGK